MNAQFVPKQSHSGTQMASGEAICARIRPAY